jgi:hypothetical protein
MSLGHACCGPLTQGAQVPCNTWDLLVDTDTQSFVSVQSPEQDSAWRMVMHLRVQEEERARLQSECEDMRTRSAVLPDLLDLLFEFDDAPPTPPPRPHVSRSAARHFGMPPRPPPVCQINRGYSVPHPIATAW